MPYSPSRCRCGNCCSGWTTLIVAFWSFDSALPTASPGRSPTPRGCLQISVTRVRRIEARALETLRGFCPQQASAQL